MYAQLAFTCRAQPNIMQLRSSVFLSGTNTATATGTAAAVEGVRASGFRLTGGTHNVSIGEILKPHQKQNHIIRIHGVCQPGIILWRGSPGKGRMARSVWAPHMGGTRLTVSCSEKHAHVTHDWPRQRYTGHRRLYPVASTLSPGNLISG